MHLHFTCARFALREWDLYVRKKKISTGNVLHITEEHVYGASSFGARVPPDARKLLASPRACSHLCLFHCSISNISCHLAWINLHLRLRSRKAQSTFRAFSTTNVASRYYYSPRVRLTVLPSWPSVTASLPTRYRKWFINYKLKAVSAPR